MNIYYITYGNGQFSFYQDSSESDGRNHVAIQFDQKSVNAILGKGGGAHEGLVQSGGAQGGGGEQKASMAESAAGDACHQRCVSPAMRRSPLR